MTIASMTGFSRVESSLDQYRWHWEIRTVNARGLDVRLRLPGGFERVEPIIRDLVRKGLARGSFSATLAMHRSATTGAIRINQAALDTILEATDVVVASGRAAPPRADGLLALRGIIEIDESSDDEEVRAELERKLIASFQDGLGQLVDMRRREGDHLKTVLLERLVEIETLTEEADSNLTRTPKAIEQRLAEQVARLLDAAPALDPQRLHQEALLLATKADIREELDRLKAHVAAARDLLDSDKPVGRKLEFLSQEFNREANTMCSKSNDVGLTRIGLALKSVVDQLREQVQNVE